MYTSSQPVNLKCTPSDRQMYKYPVGKPWFSVFSIKRKLCTALTVDSMIILPSPAEKLNKIFTKFGVQRIVDTLVLQCFVHSYCVIPSNVPFMNQHDALVCEQSDHWHDSLQTYINLHNCSESLFPMAHSNTQPFVHYSNSDSASNRYVFWLHAQVYLEFFVVYLNIIKRSSLLTVLLESYLADKVVRSF